MCWLALIETRGVDDDGRERGLVWNSYSYSYSCANLLLSVGLSRWCMASRV